MADDKDLGIGNSAIESIDETMESQELAEREATAEQVTPQHVAPQGRRDFFRAAAASAVAGTAAFSFSGDAQAQQKPKTAAPTRPIKDVNVRDFKAKLTPEQTKLTKEELSKDVKLKMAAQLLGELDNVEVQWVKGAIPGTRRVIQIKG